MRWAASTLITDPGETELINWIAFDQIADAASPTVFPILLYPYDRGVPEVSARALGGGHFTVASGDTVDHLLVGAIGSDHGDLASDARYVLLRLVRGQLAHVEASGGTYVRYRGRVVWKAETEPLQQPSPENDPKSQH